MILRPTTMGTNDTTLNYIFTNQNKYSKALEQASTEKKLNRPSDNPTDASTVLNINKKLSQLDGYMNNMETAQNELNVLDGTLASVTKSLQKANDLAVLGSSETYSAEMRQNFKLQVDQIIKNLESLGNTEYNGTYIFAGTNTGNPPFQETADGGIAYVGTPQDKDYQRYVQIADGVSTPINVSGDQLLGYYNPTTGEGTGVLKTLYQLSEALGNNDTDAIRATMDGITDGIQNTSNIRTNFASITSRFEMTKGSIETTQLQLKSYKSDLEDIDMSEAITNLQMANIALQATMSVAAQSLNSTSLLNYL